MATTQLVLPGSFSVDNTLPPKLDLHVGAKSHIFQPPATPSASSSLYRSTTSISNDYGDGFTSRKRLRHDSPSPDQIKPYSSVTTSWNSAPAVSSTASYSPGAISPALSISSKYMLAGGLDTPITQLTSALCKSDNEVISPDLALRGGRGWDRSCRSNLDSYFPEQRYVLPEENSHLRLHKSRSKHEGWGKAVYSVVGIAGRVWNFCRTNAFRGFYAGGGQGFQMNIPTSDRNCEKRDWDDLDVGDDIFQETQETSSIPGCFPEEDFIPDYMSQDHTSPLRPAKKIQIQKGGGDLRTSWVIVGNTPRSREPSATRLSARKVPQMSSPGRRPVSRAGRRPLLSATRSFHTSYAGSPALYHDRPASFASTRSPISTPKHESPINAEMQKQAARMRRREMEDDAHLKRFNQQLKAMIREGKEALGTKFEVEEMDDMIDEGYAEGDLYDESTNG